MLLYLIRHGQSEFNRIGAEAGSDSALTDLGWRQGELTGRWLQHRGRFDAFYSSSLIRARQTAEAISRHVDAPKPVALESLREASFYMLDVLPQFAHPFDVVSGESRPIREDVYQEFREQVRDALGTILNQGVDQDQKQVLVVAHGGTLGTIIRLLIGCDQVSIWTQNCATHCLGWTDNRWEIRFMNRFDYLEVGSID